MNWFSRTISVHTSFGLFSLSTYDDGKTYEASRFYVPVRGEDGVAEELIAMNQGVPLEQAKAECERRLAELEAAAASTASAA